MDFCINGFSYRKVFLTLHVTNFWGFRAIHCSEIAESVYFDICSFFLFAFFFMKAGRFLQQFSGRSEAA